MRHSLEFDRVIIEQNFALVLTISRFRAVDGDCAPQRALLTQLA